MVCTASTAGRTPRRHASLARVGINAIGSQIGWFGCVLSAAHDRPAWGVGLAVLLLALHMAAARNRHAELRLIGIVVAIGMTWDSMLAALGIVRYRSGVWLPGLAPIWIGALWALFAAMLNHSLRWLRHRLPVAVVVGAVGGPLSFWAGVRLGAAELPNLPLALGVLSAGWAMLTPAVVMLAARFDRIPVDATAEPSDG